MTSSSNNGSIMDWQSGIGTLQDGINRVLETGEQSDVEFMVGKELWDVKSQKWIPVEEPKLFKAHKLLLSIRSSVFATQFGFNNSVQDNEPIKVNDVTTSAFAAMLTFLYKEDPSLINSDNFVEVYSAANKYWIQVLVEKCHGLASKMLNWKNSVDVWRMAKLHEDKVLIEHFLQFFDNNFYHIDIKDDGIAFWSLNKEELGELLKRDTLLIWSESILGFYLYTWASKKCKKAGIDKPTGPEIRAKMGTLINEIRFPLIPPAYFLKTIVKTGILTAEEIATIFIHYSEDASDELKKLNPLPSLLNPGQFDVMVMEIINWWTKIWLKRKKRVCWTKLRVLNGRMPKMRKRFNVWKRRQKKMKKQFNNCKRMCRKPIPVFKQVERGRKKCKLIY